VVIKQNINLRNAMFDFPVPPNFAKLDSYEETQLLFQECVTVESVQPDGWLAITIPNQQTFDFPINNTVALHNYPGYIRAAEVVYLPSTATQCPALHAQRRVIVTDNLVPLYNTQRNAIISKLSIGTTLQEISSIGGWTTVRVITANGTVSGVLPTTLTTPVLSALEQRVLPTFFKQRQLLEVAARFTGWPYAWGGRSSYDASVASTTFSGVDCSGFTELAFYLAFSYELPRNSHDQYLVAQNITRRTTDDFRVGDLLFLGKTTTLRMSHVMIYAGNGMVYESAGTVGSRYIALTSKLTGVNSISDLTYGRTVIDRGAAKRFYWGRILN